MEPLEILGVVFALVTLTSLLKHLHIVLIKRKWQKERGKELSKIINNDPEAYAAFLKAANDAWGRSNT